MKIFLLFFLAFIFQNHVFLQMHQYRFLSVCRFLAEEIWLLKYFIKCFMHLGMLYISGRSRKNASFNLSWSPDISLIHLFNFLGCKIEMVCQLNSSTLASSFLLEIFYPRAKPVWSLFVLSLQEAATFKSLSQINDCENLRWTYSIIYQYKSTPRLFFDNNQYKYITTIVLFLINKCLISVLTFIIINKICNKKWQEFGGAADL